MLRENGDKRMKCKSAQRHILLALTDELPASKQAILSSHLAECDACAEYDKEATRVLDVVDEQLPSGEPRPEVLSAISRIASERARKRVLVFPLPMRQVLACAAALLFMLAGVATYLAQVQPQVSASQIAHVGTIVELLSEEEVTEEADTRALARQLLRLEGLLVDDFDVDEDAILPEELLPIDLQTRSTVVIRPAECV